MASLTETTNVINLAQAGLTVFGAVSAAIVTLVRGSLGAEAYQKALLSRRCANIRLGQGSIVAAASPGLQGIGNFSNIILCAREAKHCADAAAHHIWSFGGGEALVIVLDPYQCQKNGQRVECFRGACTVWHRDIILRSAEGSVETAPEESESLIVHSTECRGGIFNTSLLGNCRFPSGTIRLVVCVIAGFPPEKTQESDIAARMTATLDESRRGATCKAHKIILGDFTSEKPTWYFCEDWGLWSWWMLSLSEWFLALALSAFFAIDSYNASLGARRVLRSYATDYTSTSDIASPFAKSIYIQGMKETRKPFFKIQHRTVCTTRTFRAGRMLGGFVVPMLCQALWALQTSGTFKLFVKHRKSRLWQVWLSGIIVCASSVAAALILWCVKGKRTGFGGRYETQKTLTATFAYAAISLISLGIAAIAQLQLLRPDYALALCGVVQQWSCWALWFWASQEALCAGTVGERAPWHSTALLVMSFVSVVGLVVATGNWSQS